MKTLDDIPPFDPAHDNEDKPDLYQHFEDEIDYDPDQGFDDDEEDDFDSRGDAYGEDDDEDEDEDNMENLEAEDYPEEEDDYGGDDSEGEGEDDGNEARNDDSNNGDVNKPEQSLAALIQESTERIERLRNAIPVTQVPPTVPPPVITMEQVRNAKPMPDFRPGAHRF